MSPSQEMVECSSLVLGLVWYLHDYDSLHSYLLVFPVLRICFIKTHFQHVFLWKISTLTQNLVPSIHVGKNKLPKKQVCMCYLVTGFIRNALSWFLKKLNIHLTYDPVISSLDICPRQMQTSVHAETCTQRSTAILLTTAENWSHREVDKQNIVCIHTVK